VGGPAGAPPVGWPPASDVIGIVVHLSLLGSMIGLQSWLYDPGCCRSATQLRFCNI
jgi:hypothetical protein